MQFDDQLRRYFGTTDLATLTDAGREAGIERMKVDIGLETDRSRRFALWVLLHGFGEAPDIDVVFKDEGDREAARNLMDLLAQAEEAGSSPST